MRYMITDSAIEIEAPPGTGVGGVLGRRALAGMDGVRPPPASPSTGRRSRIGGHGSRSSSPACPKLVWEVTECRGGERRGRGEQRSPGGRDRSPSHEVIGTDGDRTLVRQRLNQQGPVGALVARLMHATTKRYLELEAQGLKARSEQLRGSTT